MTLTELKTIAASCKSDAEFVANPEVRRVYWKCLGVEGPWNHWPEDASGPEEGLLWCCAKECGAEANVPHNWTGQDGKPQPTCSVPDPIPGSLPDAVEVLRQKVAEKWETSSKRGSLLASICDEVGGRRTWDEEVIFAAPIDRFMVFAACLGGVTVEEK